MDLDQSGSFLNRVADWQAAHKPTPPPIPTSGPVYLNGGPLPGYVRSAIDKETSKLASMAPNSGRNHQLNRAAFNLRRFIDNGTVDEQTVYDALYAAAESCGLVAEDGDKQCEASIRSGFKGSQRKVGAKPIPEMPTNVIEVGPDTFIDPPNGALEDLEEDFWHSRKTLSLTYTAALARMTSPWAVLGAVTANILHLVPPSIVLPPLIGGNGSLNWFTAIAAKSGGGKGAAMRVAGKLVDAEILIRGIGSGEGMIECYQRANRIKDPPPPITAVLFSLDEISSLGAMSSRSGQTTLSIIKQGFSGETLGYSYRGRQGETVANHSYRMTIVAAVQPERAGILFDDSGGGTPQRFMWFPGRDRRISGDRPAWPVDDRGRDRVIPLISEHDFAQAAGIIDIPTQVADQICDQHAARNRGDDDALDGHALFCREKFAFALAVMDGRLAMSLEDWRLAGIAAAVSDWWRAKVLAAYRAGRENESRERGALRAVENDERKIIERLTEDEHVARIARWIVNTLDKRGPLTPRELTNKCAHRDRGRLGDALVAARQAGQIVSEEGRWMLQQTK